MHRHLLSAAAGVTWWRLASLPAVGAVMALAAGASGAQAEARPTVSAPAAAPGVAQALAGTWKLLPKAPVTSFPLDTPRCGPGTR